MSGRRLPLIASLAVLAGMGSACGQEIAVAEPELRRGAVLFNQRCSGCHSLDSANSHGSKPPGQLQGGERSNGPNFNTRKVQRDDALFAIRNGGFSGAIMPANIVVGKDAQDVAAFLARYSGKGEGDSDAMGQGQQSGQ